MPASETTRPARPRRAWWKSKWARRAAFVAVGVLAPVLCPMLPWPRAQLVCSALAGIAAKVGELPNVFDGGSP